MRKIVIYGYSPKHMELIYSLYSILPSCRITLVGPKDFIDSTIIRYSDRFDFDSIVLPRQTKELGIIKRLVGKVYTYYLLKNVKPSLLVTSNELAPASIIMSKNRECREIIVLDEGDFDVIFSKESVLKRYKIASTLKDLLFGLKERLKDPRITGVVTESSVVHKLIPDKIIPVTHRDYMGEIKLGDNSVIVITSPLSENKNSSYDGQELDILKKLIKTNPSFHFYIRSHYRESERKYKVLLKHSNCSYLEEYSEAPISDLEIKATYAIGFHSSALSSSGLIVDRKLSLSGFVNSEHSLAILLTLSTKYDLLDDFVLPPAS